MGRHVIVGAGTVGTGLAELLAREGHEVDLVSRGGRSAGASGVRGVALDATDVVALGRLVEGADALYNCANPRYDRWQIDWPPLASSILGAAQRSGAVLVTLSNLYGYGPVRAAMREDLALAATSRKGKVRAAMWRDALDAHEAGRARIVELRASDFFGPRVTSQGVLGERAVPRVLHGRSVTLLGDLDAPHSWSYVDDVVRALALAAGEPRSWGRAWHVPTNAPRSSREMVEGLAHAAGVATPPIHRAPWSLVRAAGLFSRQTRELLEVGYQFDRPFVVDSSAFSSAFGLEPTALDDALGSTVAWWRGERTGAEPVPAAR